MNLELKKQNDSITNNQFWRMLTITIIITTVVAGLLFYATQKYVLQQAKDKIQDLLLSHKGIHHYVQCVMHPAFYKYQEKGEIQENFYAPELLSSSFIIRNQHSFYNEERVAKGLPELYYKLAATNPRNPINKADAMEAKLIRMFNEQRNLKKYSEIIQVDNKKYLYVALPFLENQKSCIKCHGEREDAPKQLQDLYRGQGGFNEKEKDIRAIISVRAPLEREYFNVYVIFFALLAGVIAIISLFFFNHRLKKVVYRRTISLEQEILERKRAEREIVKSENKFRSMMESMSDPVYICADDYLVEYVNPAMIKRIGRDATGEFCYQALHGFDQPCSWCKNKKESHDTYLSLEIVSPKDNHSYNITHSPIMNEYGSISSMVILRDITELKKMESQLLQSQKMESIGTLAGGVAHDFNNILTAIYGYSELVLDNLEEGSEVWQDVYEIQQSGERAANLTRQLLAFSRKQIITPKALNINSLINDMQKMLSRLIREDIQLETEFSETVGSIYADSGQVEQIVINLVVNARDAVKNQPEGVKKIIKVSTSQVFLDEDYMSVHIGSSSGRYLLLQVEDNGCGIAKEVLDHVFEPFFTTKGEGKGTGMGLATVYGIVKQNGGSVNVYSEPGQGTSFKIYWPIMEGEVVEEAVCELQPALGGTEVILLAEDDEPIREISSRQLQKAGYTVIAAADGREALEKAAGYERPIDLLFTDAIMPRMGGKELSEKIKEIYPDIHVLFASGYMDNGIHQEILTLGEDRFINKPYNIQDVMIRVRRLLDGKES